MLARAAGRSTLRDGSNWSCGLQCAWTHVALLVEHSFEVTSETSKDTLKESLASVRYIILDEMSMVGRKLFGQVDRRLHQVFPHR